MNWIKRLMCGLLLVAIAGDALGQQRPGGNGPLPGDPGYGRGGNQPEVPMPPLKMLSPEEEASLENEIVSGYAAAMGTGSGGLPSFGAIAIERRGTHYGTMVKQITKDSAEYGALQYCQSADSKKCKVVLSFRDSCGALVAGFEPKGAADDVRQWFPKVGTTLDAARSAAMADCQATGNNYECVEVTKVCSASG